MNCEVLILGAGPGGLTTAYWLLKQGISVTIIEKESLAGGLMRPVKYKDFMLDYGYKQLYSRIPEVHEFWQEILGDDFLPHKSRIGVLYKGDIIEKEKNFRGLRRGMPYGLLLSSFADMLKCKNHYRVNAIESLQDYTYARRGKKFTHIFSQGFDERFNGVKWSQLPAPKKSEGKGLLAGFLRDAVRLAKKQDNWFHPAKGTGQIVERLEEEIRRMGGHICFGHSVKNIAHDNNKITDVEISNGVNQIKLKAPILVSSLPLQLMAPLMGINFEPSNKELSFRRGVVMVYLFLNSQVNFPHTSLQVSCPGIFMSRITNFGAYGGSMVPKGKGCLCIEYFTINSAELFLKDDNFIFELAMMECEKSGLLTKKDCTEFLVIRNANADPATSWEDYKTDLSRKDIYDRLTQFTNLYQINRTGTDKSTYAGIMAAKAIMNGNKPNFDSSTRPDVSAPWEI